MKRSLTRAALLPTAGVESAAGNTTKVHGSREPTGNQSTDAQDRNQDDSVQKEISHSFSGNVQRVATKHGICFKFPVLGSRT